MELEVKEGIQLIKKAYEEKNNEMLFQRWIPFSTEVSFDEFKNMLSNNSSHLYDKRTKEEILTNVKEILDSMKG